jgi:hypothetical protein
MSSFPMRLILLYIFQPNSFLLYAKSQVAENVFHKIDLTFKQSCETKGDKRTRRVRDRVFVIFERSRRYHDRYRCQEKKSCRGRALSPVYRDPPTPRTRARSLFTVRDSPPPPPPPRSA